MKDGSIVIKTKTKFKQAGPGKSEVLGSGGQQVLNARAKTNDELGVTSHPLAWSDVEKLLPRLILRLVNLGRVEGLILLPRCQCAFPLENLLNPFCT